MRTNDSGTTVTEIPCEIFTAQVSNVNLSGVQETGVQDLHCQPGNNRPVYEGDSGSPVLINGNIVGGLFGSANGVTFDARGIQQEMAAESGPPKASPSRATGAVKALGLRYFAGSQRMYNILKAKPGFSNLVFVPYPVAASRAPIGSAAPIPGLRFASPFINGPYAQGYDAATYTYELQSGLWVATAHGLEDAGAVSWPVMSFYVDGFSSGAVSGHLIGNVYGTLVYDGQEGSVINPNIAAATMPVVVHTNLNLVPLAPVTHQVRFDLGSSTEEMSVEAAAQSTLDAQLQGAANQVTANGSISITAGGATQSFNFNFVAAESQTNFLDSLGNQIDADLASHYKTSPNVQVQSITITLTATT